MKEFWYVHRNAPKCGEKVDCYSSVMLALAQGGHPDDKLFRISTDAEVTKQEDFTITNLWSAKPGTQSKLGSVTVSDFTAARFYAYVNPTLESIARNMAKLCDAPGWLTEDFAAYDPIASAYIRARLIDLSCVEKRLRSQSMVLALIGWEVLDSMHDHDFHGLAKLIDIASILYGGVVNNNDTPVFFQIFHEYVMKINLQGTISEIKT